VAVAVVRTGVAGAIVDAIIRIPLRGDGRVERAGGIVGLAEDGVGGAEQRNGGIRAEPASVGRLNRTGGVRIGLRRRSGDMAGVAVVPDAQGKRAGAEEIRVLLERCGLDEIHEPAVAEGFP
jgi:hypothetical protein